LEYYDFLSGVTMNRKLVYTIKHEIIVSLRYNWSFLRSLMHCSMYSAEKYSY